MSFVLVGPIAILILAVAPYGLAHLAKSLNAPQIMGGGFFFVLMAWAVIPIAWLMCAGSSAIALVAHRPLTDLGCELGLGSDSIRLAGYIVGLVFALPLAIQVIRTVKRTQGSRLGLRVDSTLHQMSSTLGGQVNVIDAPQLIAASAGLLRPRAFVSRGTLQILSSNEANAVIEHEAAHVRLGHTRLITIGAPVMALVGFLPPVRTAWHAMIREFEVAADHEARRCVGTQSIRRALAKLVLAHSQRPVSLGFGDPADLRYRLDRLKQPLPTPQHRLIATLLGLISPAVALAVTTCALTTVHLISPSLFICAIVIGCSMAIVIGGPLAFPVRGFNTHD
jgi:Zn-dependent protease with chaperone function